MGERGRSVPYPGELAYNCNRNTLSTFSPYVLDIPDSRHWIPDVLSVDLGFRIPITRPSSRPGQIIRDQTLDPLFKDQELTRNLHLRLINNFDRR